MSQTPETFGQAFRRWSGDPQLNSVGTAHGMGCGSPTARSRRANSRVRIHDTDLRKTNPVGGAHPTQSLRACHPSALSCHRAFVILFFLIFVRLADRHGAASARCQSDCQ